MSLFALLFGSPPFPPPNPVPDLYELGPVYIWRDEPWIHPALRGKETTVIAHAEVTDWCPDHQTYHILQLTDSELEGEKVHAAEGELVRRDVPPGEQMITDIINNPTKIKEPETV